MKLYERNANGNMQDTTDHAISYLILPNIEILSKNNDRNRREKRRAKIFSDNSIFEIINFCYSSNA